MEEEGSECQVAEILYSVPVDIHNDNPVIHLTHYYNFTNFTAIYKCFLCYKFTSCTIGGTVDHLFSGLSFGEKTLFTFLIIVNTQNLHMSIALFHDRMLDKEVK